jgi:DNA-binding protein HU-beta
MSKKAEAKKEKKVEEAKETATPKQFISTKIAEEYDISKDMAYKICQACLDAVHEACLFNGKVRIGSHSFKIIERKARDGRNPKTGEPLKIKASRRVAYKNTDKTKR